MRVELSCAVAPVWGSAVTWPSLAVSWLAACSDLDWSWVVWPSAYSVISFDSGVWVWVREAYLGRRATGNCTNSALSETGGRVDVGLEGGRVVVGHCDCVLGLSCVSSNCLYSIDLITFSKWLYRGLYIYRKVMTSWR